MGDRGKVKLNEVAAARFVAESVRAVADKEKPSVGCVDGRDQGELSVPGAHAGYLLTVLAAFNSLDIKMDDDLRERVMGVVVDSVGGPGEFKFHTDSYAVDEAREKGLSPEQAIGAGCGHMRMARAHLADYGVTQEDMSAISRKLLDLRDNHGAEERVLQGEHGETAVFVVNEVEHELRHQSNGDQAFVFQAGLNDLMLDKLSRELARSLAAVIDLDEKKIREALEVESTVQRNLTVGALAHGRPLYTVSFPSGKPVIEQSGDVPERRQEV